MLDLQKKLQISGSTSPLQKYLKLIHKIDIKQLTKNVSASTSKTPVIPSTSQTSVTNDPFMERPSKKTKRPGYFKLDDRREVVVSKLATLDGFSFKVLPPCYIIQQK